MTLSLPHSLIANSAPIINAVIIIGCIMLLVACYLLGIDSGTPQVDPNVQLKELLSMIDDYSKSRYAIICTVSKILFIVV